MLADNIQYLKKNYPVLFSVIKELDPLAEKIEMKIEMTRNNKKTMYFQTNGTKIYLHSRYDPQREAVSVIKKMTENEKIDENTHVVFFGIGLGYHIEEFAEQFPDTEFSIFEPSSKLFNIYLDEMSLKSSSMKKLVLLHCVHEKLDLGNYFKELFIKVADKKVVILELPIYERLFEEQFTEFLKSFKNYTREKRMNFHTEFKFQKTWTKNSVSNLKNLLKTPNILMQHADVFKEKPAIIVSAGPSLDYEIENLRKIKQEGLAFLISVGSAISTLISNDIFPDAICGFDASNVIVVYKKLIECGVDEIPFIFGSRIGPVVIEEYKGPKYHMLVNVDKINLFFLKDKDDSEMKVVFEAPSIAVVAMQLVHFLGFSKIILAGQNFSYFNNKNYAKGIDYQSIIDPTTDKRLETTLDVNGDEVFTNVGFNAMRRQMEGFIEKLNLDVINTTVGGAAIKGSEFMPMDTVISQLLTEKTIFGNEFEMISKTSIYDRKYLLKKIIIMEKAFKQYQEIVQEIKTLIAKIRPLINNKNKSQVESMYNKLDRAVIAMEQNTFFNLIAMPFNVVHYYYLMDQTDRIKTEKNMFEKIKQYIEQLDKFISHLNDDVGNLTELMNDLSSYKSI